MTKTLHLIPVVALLCVLVLVGAALAQSSMNYDLSWHVMASGGSEMESTGHIIQGTMGQVNAGIAESPSYAMTHGYWYRNPPQLHLYLPLVTKNAG
jgi:hypothetical protein